MKQAQLLETVRGSLQYNSYLKTAILSVTAAASPTPLYIVQSSANDYNIVAIGWAISAQSHAQSEKYTKGGSGK